MGDLQQPASSTSQHLFRDDDMRHKYRVLVQKSLLVYPVIDPTKGGVLRMRLSATEPAQPEIERGLSQTSVDFHAAAQPIEIASGGAKAFTGLFAETIAGDPQVLPIDEPDAFLHPSLAFNLGREDVRLRSSVSGMPTFGIIGKDAISGQIFFVLLMSDALNRAERDGFSPL